jgi:hypothetical protein
MKDIYNKFIIWALNRAANLDIGISLKSFKAIPHCDVVIFDPYAE